MLFIRESRLRRSCDRYARFHLHLHCLTRHQELLRNLKYCCRSNEHEQDGLFMSLFCFCLFFEREKLNAINMKNITTFRTSTIIMAINESCGEKTQNDMQNESCVKITCENENE